MCESYNFSFILITINEIGRYYETCDLMTSIAGILEDRDEKNKGGALFFREYGRTASYYANRSFEPVFASTPELIIPANRSVDIEKANELCGDSYQCKYDYAVSLNRDLAFYTLQYQDGYVNTKKMSKQRGDW